MRKVTQAIGFIAGAAFAASLLVWCGGVPGAQGEAPDAGGSATCDCPAPPPPERSAIRSGDRIKARVLRSADGAQVLISMHDSQRQEDCTVETYTDGKVRCVPAGAPAGSRHVDDKCTVPFRTVADGDTPPKYVWFQPLSNGPRSLRPLGAEVHLDKYYVLEPDGRCHLGGEGTPPIGRAFELGAEVPSAELSEFNEVLQ